MCVAIPGVITWVGKPGDATIPGRIEAGGEAMDVDLVMVPTASVGDYVITHAGYAIRLVPAEQARETRRLLG
jgi:hydrogenase expression/formation protein HypC